MESQNRDEPVSIISQNFLRYIFVLIDCKRENSFNNSYFQYPRHLFVHIGGPALSYADPLLEVSINSIVSSIY